MMPPRVETQSFIDVQHIDATAGLGAFVASAAVTAADYLGRTHWGAGFRAMWFAGGVVGVAALFLVQLTHSNGAAHDEYIWVVTGNVPTAYFVTDRARDPSSAMRVYGELAADWISAHRHKIRQAHVFPFDWPTDSAGLGLLEARIGLVNTDAQGWMGPHECPIRTGGCTEPPGGAEGTPRIRVGALVRDHRGDFGVVLQRVPIPSRDWLGMQKDAWVRSFSGVWWKIAVVSGGSAYVPEAGLQEVDDPSGDLVREAMRNANEFGRRAIAKAMARDE